MDQYTHKVRAEYWKGIIKACGQRPAGQSAKSWLDENGICEQSYYHWQRKFRKQVYGVKKKGQWVENLKDFPQEKVEHDVPLEELSRAFVEGNWKSMPDEIFWQLRFEPSKWNAEKHVVKVYVGTAGLHQDEFLRGNHPATLFRGSISGRIS